MNEIAEFSRISGEIFVFLEFRPTVSSTLSALSKVNAEILSTASTLKFITMAAPTTTTEFVELLRRSGIIPPATLQKLLEQLPLEPVKAAGYLVKLGALTPFQAKLILSGRHRGFKLGPYIILDQIGQGGMGMVYQAEHETLRRKVAIKILTSTESKNNITIERFQREARAAAALDHPNIVRIFDVACQGETHYLVMEYIDGETLDQINEKSGPMACGRAVELMLQACAGLQHAYEKGFVHRDIKPANLILSKDNTLKILDMGLARSFDNSDKLTELLDQGSVVGTADFISPEQAMNSPGQDIRADIYSLGATFFSLVTGRPPFEGNTTQKLIQHQMKEPPTIGSIDKTFPSGLSEVVSKMLKKRPDDRYQTPAEVMAALGPWLPSNSRVVATLSRTNLPQTAAQKAQMENVVKSLTGQMPSTTEKVPTKRSLLPILLAVPVLGGLVVGGSLLAMSYLKKPNDKLAVLQSTKPAEVAQEVTTPPTTQTVQTTPATVKVIEPTPKVTRPVTALKYPVGTLIYELDLTEAKPYRELGSMAGTGSSSKFLVKDKSGNGRLPSGWTLCSWKPDAHIEAQILENADGKSLTMATMADTRSGMLFSPEVRLPTAVTKLLLEYRTTSKTGNPMLRFRPTRPLNQAAKDVAILENTQNEWKTLVVDWDSSSLKSGIFEFHSWNLPSEASLEIRKWVIYSASPVAEPAVMRLDLSGQAPFRNRYAYNSESQAAATVAKSTGDGKLPEGWTVPLDGATTEVEVFAQGTAEAMHLSFHKTKGPAAGQLDSPEFTVKTPKARVRVVYQLASPVVLMRFRPTDGSLQEPIAKLPSSHLAWSTWEQEVDWKEGKPGRLEFVSLDTQPANALRIREIQIFEVK
jgi:serine/threonine protein kinase